MKVKIHINRAKEFYRSVPRTFKTKYAIAIYVFCIWMFFFDRNNIFTQYSLRTQITEMEQKKEYYAEKILEVEHDQERLFTNPFNLERFAREKYYMKKDDEDIFIIVRESE